MNVRCGAALAFATMVLLPFPARVCAQSAVPPYIAAAHVFLTAWGHERWDELQGVAADAVTVRFEDRVFSLKPASRKSEIRVVFPFRGLSLVRTGAEVKGVAVDELGGQAGGKETRGPATLTLREEGGRFRIIGVSFGASRRAHRTGSMPGTLVAARRTSHDEWSCPQAMGAPRSAMEVVVKKVLGYERDEKEGWAVLLEVEIGGTVQELCRLVFPTEDGIAALRKFIADASTTPRPGTN